MPENYVIITAGGIGSRMGTPTPKQFLELNNLPVIMHSMAAFLAYSTSVKLILVLPEDFVADWKSLCEKYQFTHAHEICIGGNTRFQSVKNGLKLAGDEGLVAIHDAARPLLSQFLIDYCFKEAALKGNAVPSLHLKDSVRELSGEENRPIDRDKLRLIQTPQVFEASLIKKAFEQAFKSSFTDDASVVESMGIGINLVAGEEKNIKITTPVDLTIAEAILAKSVKSGE